MKIATIVFLSLMLAGCTRSLEISTKPVEFDLIKPQLPASLQMMPMEFFIVNKINQDEFLSKIYSENGAFIAMPLSSYENLSNNLSDILRYIRQQNAIRQYYEKVTGKPLDAK